MPVRNPKLGGQMMADAKFYSDYSRWNPLLQRHETYPEAVDRVMDMHRQKYSGVMSPELKTHMTFARNAYESKRVLGAQRALQWGGEQIFKHNGRMYNCAASWASYPEFFQNAMYLLLCGAGVGFSVQGRHINQLPKISWRRDTESKVFVISDSIEGWSDAFGVLYSSYMSHWDNGPFPEYRGKIVHYDFSQIRPKGAEISGGFRAPGPDPLRKALIKCEELLERTLRNAGSSMAGPEEVALRPITVYDFVMHMADAVVSGGVRRAATLCMFDRDDEEMLNAKTGNWLYENPQRARSNNSVVLLRSSVTREQFAEIIKRTREFGEPGFIFTDNLDFVFNPCVEIGMLPVTEDGRPGFQMCNLTEINGGMCNTFEEFIDACQAAAILGTLQAGYTDFAYLGEASEEIIRREALIGVSITGWMNNPEVLFDERTMKAGAWAVIETNQHVAKLIGINPAARTTCVKPSGNASVLLGTASGIHGEHAPRYFRNVQLTNDNPVAKLLAEHNPAMVEPSQWNLERDVVVSFPITTKEDSYFKRSLLGIDQLKYVMKAQQNWVEYGTNVELCRDPALRHNVSNTIQVNDWTAVEEYLYDNRQWFAGVSLIDATGDSAYVQAPFTQVYDREHLIWKYGDAAIFASGLIVDGLYAFDENLWVACDTVLGGGVKLHQTHSKDLLKRDWIRRAHGFAENYFQGDRAEMIECLKKVYNLHRWNTIQRQLVAIDFASELDAQTFTDVDGLAGAACAGGACELTF